MSIVNNKFLSMSLDDIVEAIQTLQDTVATLMDSSDAETPDLQTITDNYADLADRVDALEAMIQDSSSGSSEIDIDVQDISDRVQALEEINNEFFGV